MCCSVLEFESYERGLEVAFVYVVGFTKKKGCPRVFNFYVFMYGV